MIYLFKINKLSSFSVGYKFKLTRKFEVRKTETKIQNKQKNPAISHDINVLFNSFHIFRWGLLFPYNMNFICIIFYVKLSS